MCSEPLPRAPRMSVEWCLWSPRTPYLPPFAGVCLSPHPLTLHGLLGAIQGLRYVSLRDGDWRTSLVAMILVSLGNLLPPTKYAVVASDADRLEQQVDGVVQ